MGLVIGNSLLLIFVIVELFILNYVKKEAIPWKEIITNLSAGHILLWVFRGVEVAAYYATYKYFSFGWVNVLPVWAVWLLAFIFWDFCFYWMHRIHHYYKILWGVHSVHHEGEHFSLSLGIRNSWYSSLTSFPFYIVLALIGVPVDIFVAVSSIQYFIQFYNHNHIVKKSGWLEKILVTPSHHRVHHGKNKPYLHTNFAGTFIIWDKLFNTYQEELEEPPVIFGIDNVPLSNNPVLINTTPFMRMFGSKKRPIERPVSKPIYISNSILVIGALQLFLFLLFYIYFETVIPDQRPILLFAMVFIGTIGNGLLSEGKRLGLLIWSISSLAFPLLLLSNFYPGFTLFKLLLITFFIQGLFTLSFVLRAELKGKMMVD